ncbi:MAG: MFS transporter, partial [Pseudomonadales bacterium]|nr:MFS transporter [Pseudomonadales bacterium]
MILPVFSVYGMALEGATPLLVGVAIGAYGLTQALLQVPFGLASDRFGRKPVIIAGLVIFLIGSVVAAYADNIYGVIFGRALQGAGAIASAVMALLADLTRDDNRTKAMAMVGASIGVSFALALILGPLLAGYDGLAGLFWLTAHLAGLGILITIFLVPTPVSSQWHRENRPVLGQFSEVMRNRELLRLDFGVFLLHLTLTASFVAVPLMMVSQLEFANQEHWKLYLPVMLVAFIFMVPLMIVAEAKRRIKEVFLLAILLLGCGLLMLYLYRDSLWQVAIGLFVYFWAFNLLEAMLPSLVSKIAPPGSKGTSMGVYSASQFMGAFVG